MSVELEPVRAAVERGYSVIPIRADKKPTGSWKRAQTSRATIDELEALDRPAAWAIVTGDVSGVIALDFDGTEGRELLERLGLQPHVKTGSGGAHVYVKHPGRNVPTLNGKAKPELGRLWPGLDVKGDGGYAIFAGRNKVGGYELLRELEPEPIEKLPTELRDYLVGDTKAGATEHELLEWALNKASPGCRNKVGFDLACQLRDNGHPEGDAERVLRGYAAHFDETYTEAEAIESVGQAYRKPARDPWPTVTDDEGESVDALGLARKRLKLLNLKRVVKRGSMGALYDLELTDGSMIPLGDSAALMNPRKVEAAVADATGIAIPYAGPSKFRPVAAALLAIAVLDASGPTPDDVTRGWLAAFLEGRVDPDVSGAYAPNVGGSLVDLADQEQRAVVIGNEHGEHPDAFRSTDRCVYVHLPSFESYVRNMLKVPTTTRDLSARLRRIDFERVQLEVPTDGRKRKRWYWHSPIDFDPSEGE